ncbi:putative lipoprotein [Pseudohaliea rubra DSM 19751]|uniref:Putative lipoprotein n=2 Tax=Pseudohaliea TaxID=1341120 RepID=A0A095VTI1_9GAMM|nr:putative lipoprotein [Pseudohaliea rubra DSM 19751]
MRAGNDDEGLRVYRSPGARDAIRASDAMMLEPVQLWLAADDEGLTDEQGRELGERFYATLYTALADDYRMVEEAGPETLRFEVALTSAEAADVKRDLITKAVAPARILSTAASKISGEPMFQGSATIEAKLSDASTGEVWVASIDRRVGGNAINTETLQSWGDVYNIMDLWAAAIRYKLCSARAAKTCEKP